MENEDEVTNFTICKIESLVAHRSAVEVDAELTDSNDFQIVSSKFKDLFQMPDNERLVNYYSCRLCFIVYYIKIGCKCIFVLFDLQLF